MYWHNLHILLGSLRIVYIMDATTVFIGKSASTTTVLVVDDSALVVHAFVRRDWSLTWYVIFVSLNLFSVWVSINASNVNDIIAIFWILGSIGIIALSIYVLICGAMVYCIGLNLTTFNRFCVARLIVLGYTYEVDILIINAGVIFSTRQPFLFYRY